MIGVDVTLFDLNDRLDHINCRLHNSDTRMVVSVEYYRTSMDSEGHIRFTCIKLQNDDNVRTTFSILYRCVGLYFYLMLFDR